ncbi:hypothetical protein ACFWC3_40455, partial [Streptomyces goshikiensis]
MRPARSRHAATSFGAALAQVRDMGSVGRQALTETWEARLAAEIDRARGALTASDRRAALLGWVVREYVTNVIRHSGAATREIEVRGSAERVRLVITDGGGVGATPPGSGPAPGRGSRPRPNSRWN